MPRVKGGVNALKRRRSVLKAAKGFRFGRGNKEKAAREAILHAGVHAFAARRDKKSLRRRLWEVKLNAALRPLGYSYSKFIGDITKKEVKVDRKILATLAEFHPETFKRVVASVKA